MARGRDRFGFDMIPNEADQDVWDYYDDDVDKMPYDPTRMPVKVIMVSNIREEKKRRRRR